MCKDRDRTKVNTMRKGEYFVITADGQIIIVQQEELNRAQVDGAEDGQTLHLREKENNISLSLAASLSVSPPLPLISLEKRGGRVEGWRGAARAVAGRQFARG